MNKYQKEKFDAALEYAARGWKVIPCKADKTPLNHNGSRGGSTDIIQIAQWWERWAYANVGICTGKDSGIFVVDVDMKNGINGMQSLTETFGNLLEFNMDTHLVAKTPTEGIHFFFEYPLDREISNAQGILEGVDVRGDGGYVIAAPSTIGRKKEDGTMEYLNDKPYRWKDVNSVPSPILPWVEKLLTLQKVNQTKSSDFSQVFSSGFSQGNRDAGLISLVGMMSGRGVPKDMAEAVVEYVANKCNPPFPVVDALAKVDYVYRKKAMQIQKEDKITSQVIIGEKSNG